MTFSNSLEIDRLEVNPYLKQAVEQMEALLRVRAELVRTAAEPEIVSKISTIINDLVRSLPTDADLEKEAQLSKLERKIPWAAQ
jgi:hypothetical protein